MPSPLLLAIVGPTASGKSDIAIALARAHDGEIISVDSRQVYRGMDIGTGKVPKDPSSPPGTFFSEGVRHHLIDVADPAQEYNISHFLKDATAAIADIRSRAKQPILCGGTHFWIQALIEGHTLPVVPPDPLLRASLATRTPVELFTLLQARDPKRAETIDPHNALRLIRALEIGAALGQVPPLPAASAPDQITATRIVALSPSSELLRERIHHRLMHRLDQGMLSEIETLHTQGVSWERLESFGLEYRFLAQFLQGTLDETSMQTKLEYAIWHYARRQLSWLRRWERQGTEIQWVSDPVSLLL